MKVWVYLVVMVGVLSRENRFVRLENYGVLLYR